MEELTVAERKEKLKRRILAKLSAAYMPGSAVYQTVRKALGKLSYEELSSLWAMATTSCK